MIVFTNGCFDIIHPGHVDLLERARGLGTSLIVGINSDRSVRQIKGPGRPFMGENERASVLMGLRAVDEVRIFDESTPESLIHEIRPDILVKGGDWAPDEIIGSDFVLKTGGRVLSLPLLQDFSSSGIVERVKGQSGEATAVSAPHSGNSFAEHIATMEALVAECSDSIAGCSSMLIETVRNGNKILICGNGGSAADAQHIAAEFVGRYETERRALPAIALTTDTSALTALANDYDFERIFSRQVEALANAGDCLIALSTSGNSPNVIAAVMAARNKGCRIVGLTGAKGKKLSALSDECVMVPSERTARIQEAHITIAHVWCEAIDKEFA